MMRAYAFPLGLGALLALAGLLAVMVVRPAAAPGRVEVARGIAAGLRCPDCQGLSVADSSSASAVAIRREIEAQLSAGRTPDEIRQSFVDRYGEWILLSPTAPLAWLVPIGVLLVAIALLAVWVGRTRGAARPLSLPAVSESDRARAREEAEALDA